MPQECFAIALFAQLAAIQRPICVSRAHSHALRVRESEVDRLLVLPQNAPDSSFSGSIRFASLKMYESAPEEKVNSGKGSRTNIGLLGRLVVRSSREL